MTIYAPAEDDGGAGVAVSAEQFESFMNGLKLGADNGAMVIAVSGGPDSMALVRLTQEWATAREIQVYALTVDHRLREEAADEATLVSTWLDALDVPHHTLVWREGETVKHLTRSSQAAAREGRFDLMSRWCADHNVKTLMTAHHADDQAETFLMRLIRGSGVDGLAAMSGKSKRGTVTLLRPLLEVTKADLVATCERFNQPWVHDPSNDSDSYGRTRIRKIMSALETEGLHRDRLLKTVAHMQRAQAAIDSMVDTLMADAFTDEEAGAVTLNVCMLCDAPEEIALRSLARCLKSVSGATYAPRFDSLERVFKDLKTSLEGSHEANAWTDRTLHGCQLRLANGVLRVSEELQKR